MNGGLEVIKSSRPPDLTEETGEVDKEKMADEFISKNPNPILRVGKEGTVLYANKAANPLLEYWSTKIGEKVPQLLRHSIKRVLSQKNQKNQKTLEIRAGEKTYSILLHPFPEEGYVNIQGFDISSRVLDKEKSRSKENQYLSLTNLGRISTTCKDFQAILEKSSQLVAQGLKTEFSTILELLPDGNFILRAGYGWEESLLGSIIMKGKEESQAGFTLFSKKPIILRNIQTETRFKCPEILKANGIISGATVLIGNKNKPFGVMGVYSRVQREFAESDIYFLDSAAFLLSEIIEKFKAEEQLRLHQQELEKLVESRTLEYKKTNEKLTNEGSKREKIEKTLLYNLKFLETLLNTIPTPVFYKDNRGRFLGCNDFFASQVLGLQKEKITGKILPEVYISSNPEIPLQIHKNDLEFLSKEGSDSYEQRLTCADGRERNFLVSRATFFDEKKVGKMIAVLLDVTKLRKVEEELQNNVRFLETLLDNIPSPIFQRDLKSKYVNCNESFAMQIMGLHKEKVIGGSFAEFEKRVPKELAEIYKRDDRKLIENGGTQYYETKVNCADNVQRDFLFHKATYEDNFGKVAGVVGVMLDITQLKEAEKSFKEGEERYRIAAEQTGQIVYDYNGITDKIEWAGAIKELTGYSLEEFKNFNLKTWEAHRHFEDRRTVLEQLKSYRQKGERFKIEYRFRRKDGSYFYVEDSGTFLKDENGKSYRTI
ncbi:MAG TPA: PAS domain S-box protein, partial [Methanosarcina sp.]|nr:PAS domain S-box protein [Methanosarcina sp.]